MGHLCKKICVQKVTETFTLPNVKKLLGKMLREPSVCFRSALQLFLALLSTRAPRFYGGSWLVVSYCITWSFKTRGISPRTLGTSPTGLRWNQSMTRTGSWHSLRSIARSRTIKFMLSSNKILLIITGNVLASPSCSISFHLLHLNHSACLNLKILVCKLYSLFAYIQVYVYFSICVLICSCNLY